MFLARGGPNPCHFRPDLEMNGPSQVLIRLRDDPVGIAFPLARWPGHHALAEDLELIDSLQREGNSLPWRGNGRGRSFTSHTGVA